MGKIASGIVALTLATSPLLLPVPVRAENGQIAAGVVGGLIGGALLGCQSAFKFDPVSASNFDPFERRVLTVALVSSELAGIAETRRARVV